MISDQSVEEYRRILREDCGIDVSPEKAREQGESLLRLYQAVLTPKGTEMSDIDAGTG